MTTTDDDDLLRFAEISRELPAIDLDAQAAERIARVARGDLGKGPSPRRFVEPALAGIVVTAYLVWVILKALELLG
jgi:hypothetical protein